MKWLCWMELHRWREELVLEQTMPSGLKLFLDEDVCQRCDALRNPENVANVYALMANNQGEILIYPPTFNAPYAAPDQSSQEKP